MPITKGYKQLITEARVRIRTLTLDEAKAKFEDPNVSFIDIRDARELERDGMIPGAFHAPRGMLEFWVDPDSPYYKGIFGSGKEFVLYCASAWRSSLATATLQDMGLSPVMHIEGGFKAWKEAGLPVEQPSKPK
ncbi:Rhodanese domain-containing protein [Hyphomicrobium denitrificans 1NES1]|uniref:Rhodanese domain-containing protein n=1 Tax=Hyphomicrobium denitrificans 1NES1 TaxID=670307 RepID=N0B4U7_9HYPH|nr:Rhodanese domain-containing protein [Hyphomicrobium denitrificans 1NES1]